MKLTLPDGTLFEGSLQEFEAYKATLIRGAPTAPWDPNVEEMQIPEDSAASDSWKSHLPKLRLEQREGALVAFRTFVQEWNRNWGVSGPQPNRVTLMQDLGSSRWAFPLLVLAYERESLQRLVLDVYGVEAPTERDLDSVNELCANMVQVSHSGFPDLAGTYDYTQKWRRTS